MKTLIVKREKEYTKFRQFYAWVGFITIIAGVATVVYKLLSLTN